MKQMVTKNRSQFAAMAAFVCVALAGGAWFWSKSVEAEKQLDLARQAMSASQAGEKSAKEQEQLARAQAAEISARAAQDRIFADIARLQDAELRADAMWPAVPSRIPEFEQWLRDIDVVVQRLPEVESELAAVRQRAKPMSDEARAAAREAAAAEVGRLRADFDLADARDRRALRLDIANAEAAVENSGYEFEARSDGDRHRQLAKLAAWIRASQQDGQVLARGAIPSIRARLEEAKAMARTMETHDAAWRSAIAAIAASDRYGGMKLRAHEGLVPIGMDPESKLWEFVHVASGAPGEEIPVRDAETGQLVLTAGTGMVLVLVPGGTFQMGAQKADPGLPNHDPQAVANEGPVHEVALSPFFVCKHELTQGQWLRWSGRNPSPFAGSGDLLLPVDTVTWFDCEEAAQRWGLSLPTEAQWEYACRAGTTTPWWTGDSEEAHAAGAVYGEQKVARIGSKAANAFGLFDVAGNVAEWCRDSWDGSANYTSSSASDPVLSKGPYRVLRGGGWRSKSNECRSAVRTPRKPDNPYQFLGVRLCLAPVSLQ